MKNLFNWGKTLVAHRQTEDELVAEIHAAFDNSENNLLEQAREVLRCATPDDRAERMRKLGFIASETVVNHVKEKAKVAMNRTVAYLIETYREQYPFTKFLTFDALCEICDKYGLVFLPVANYLNDVPEKNLREIEAAKPLSNFHQPDQFRQYMGAAQNLVGTISTWVNVNSGIWRNSHDDAMRDAQAITKRYGITTTLDRVIGHKGLHIAAPPSHFNTDGMVRAGNTFVVEPKDPIVFRYCKGGIQVLSKWGLEANDPALTNEIEN